MGLLLAGTVLGLRHRSQPLPWLRRLLLAGRRRIRKSPLRRYEYGIDLRGVPPYRSGTPPLFYLLTAAFIGWSVFAAAGWLGSTVGWRPLTAGTFYLAHLIGIALLWVGLLIVIVPGIYVPVFLFQAKLERVRRTPDRRTIEATIVVAYALTILLLAGTFPVFPVLGLCLVVAVVAAVLAWRSPTESPAILWRQNPRRKIRSIPLPRLVGWMTAFGAVLAFNLILTACGGQLVGNESAMLELPLTGTLGSVAAWLMPGIAWLTVQKTWRGRQNDPAQRTPAGLCLIGGTPTERAAIAAQIRLWGWELRPAGTFPSPEDVSVRIVASESESHAEEFEPAWPLPLTVEDFRKRVVQERLIRRDEILLRRKIFRGLSRLMKAARAERGKGSGGGSWFAPHWWFVDSLNRDEGKKGREPDSMRGVGEPYAALFGTRARQHLHEVLRSTRVDMIFLEDGVQAKSVERVLRALFELYDVHGGTRTAQDQHFQGIPKVRVMLHEYEPGVRFPSTTKYREPSFADLSRARVMHIFKDRGGLEDQVETPFDTSWEPAPAAGAW
jgi:hypothetical protein